MTKKQQTILIVEDDASLGEILAEKLTDAGYNIILTSDGEKGFEQMKTQKPDLVLLDIKLPKISGYEVLELQQKNKKLKNIPVIIISNSGQLVELNRAFALGVKDYIVKAVLSPDEVLKKVQEQLKTSLSRSKTKKLTSLKGAKILVVEDDSLLQSLLTQKLSKENCELFYAIDGEMALRVANEKKPDLILLDLVLPTISGFDVLKRLKSNSELKDIPVIILSNLGQQLEIDKGMKLGAKSFLIKANFSVSEIIDEIKKIIKEKNKKIRLVIKEKNKKI